jgi:hypothetical protein
MGGAKNVAETRRHDALLRNEPFRLSAGEQADEQPADAAPMQIGISQDLLALRPIPASEEDESSSEEK